MAGVLLGQERKLNKMSDRIHETVAKAKLWVPDIMEFTVSDEFLRRSIYPRQATALKLAFLQTELFTDYDYEVVGQWARLFEETGDNGCQPDIFERIRICKEEGRPWFREWLNIWGRRGGKGFVGAIAGAYVLWNFICMHDPQGRFGIDRDKQLGMIVFAGKKEQARTLQWKDLTDMIKGGRCFSPWISRSLTESLTLRVPYDEERIAERKNLGIPEDSDMASIVILPKESTTMAARGPAVFAFMFDEMAHVVRQVAKSDASEVYHSATPALDTFGEWAWMYEGSSPWAKTGQFYENWEQSLAVSDGTDGLQPGEIVRPEMLMLQLASWDPYVDWERADKIPTMPRERYERHDENPTHEGRRHAFCYPHQKRAQQDSPEDDTVSGRQMRRMEAANPETFAVERRSHWAAVMDQYLNEDRIKAIWLPWPDLEQPDGTRLVLNDHMRTEGKLAVLYKAHGDPSKSGANFGFAIAHMVRMRGDDFPHVVFDYITHWQPAHFPENNYQVDYDHIETELKGFIRNFIPSEVTFDQGFSNWLISRLAKWVRRHTFPKMVSVFQRTATLQQNWEVAETFKTAIGLGLVHAPYYEQADLELQFLQLVGENKVDKPTAGPVQTKDVADCMMILVHALIGNEIAAFINQDLSDLPLRGSMAGGLPTPAEQAAEVSGGDPMSAFRNVRGTGIPGSGRRPAGSFSPARGRFSGMGRGRRR